MLDARVFRRPGGMVSFVLHCRLYICFMLMEIHSGVYSVWRGVFHHILTAFIRICTRFSIFLMRFLCFLFVGWLVGRILKFCDSWNNTFSIWRLCMKIAWSIVNRLSAILIIIYILGLYFFFLLPIWCGAHASKTKAASCMKTINAEVNVRSAFPSDPHDTPLYSHVQYVRQYTVVTYILQCMHHAMALRLRIIPYSVFVCCLFFVVATAAACEERFFLACVRSVTFHGNSCIQLKSYIRLLLWHNGSSAYLVFLLLLRFSFSRLWPHVFIERERARFWVHYRLVAGEQ